MTRVLVVILLITLGTAIAPAKAMGPVQPLESPDYCFIEAVTGLEEKEMLLHNYYDTTAPKAVRLADSLAARKHSKDTAAKKINRPRAAAIRSAIIPGWGQVYNKKYWKVPIVWAAVGIPAALFIDNKKWYDRTRYALSVVVNGSYNNPDSMAKVHSQLRPLVDRRADQSLLNYRNEFRRNMDYSILVGLLLWGLNVVDATVDAHLRDFDISDDISMRVVPAILPGNAAGLSLVFTLGTNNRSKSLPSLR